MTQRQLNKLIKIKKILKVKEDEAVTGEIKEYIVNDTMPRHKKNLEISQQLKDFHDNMIKNRLFPSMPDDNWIARHGSIAQPDNYDVNLDDGIFYGPYKESDL